MENLKLVLSCTEYKVARYVNPHLKTLHSFLHLGMYGLVFEAKVKSIQNATLMQELEGRSNIGAVV